MQFSFEHHPTKNEQEIYKRQKQIKFAQKAIVMALNVSSILLRIVRIVLLSSSFVVLNRFQTNHNYQNNNYSFVTGFSITHSPNKKGHQQRSSIQESSTEKSSFHQKRTIVCSDTETTIGLKMAEIEGATDTSTNVTTTLQTQLSIGTGTDPDNRDSPSKVYATLLIKGPDQTGIVAAFAQTLFGHGCSIYEAEQSTDRNVNLFFQRIRFDYSNMITDRYTLENGIKDICTRLGMEYVLHWGDTRKKIAIFVSKYDHCLWELLLRYRGGELHYCDISMIVSNHMDLKSIADTFNIPFHYFPINKQNKKEQELNEIELLKHHSIDLIILARYMQIVSDHFCNTFQYQIINIHHSFLPAFIGSRPYHRAHERGVKLIGATAHYATADLDEGPIIEQDTTRISHRDDVNDLIRKGRTLEKNVLIAAVRAHVEDRIIVYGNKCIIFGSS